MTKIFLVLFILLVCSYLNNGKAEKSDEIADKTENTKSGDDEDESASIQVVQRGVVAEQQDKPLVEYGNNPQEEENDTEVQTHEEENETEVLKDTNTNSTKAEAKYDAFFEDLISDSGEIHLKNRDDNNEEVSGVVSLEENNEYKYNNQDKIAIAFEDITKAYNHDEKSQEDITIVDDDENNWRSAEKFHSDENKYANEATNEESVEDDKNYSVEDYMDKKSDLEVRGRMETKHPERRQHFNTRPNVRHYEPPENHGLLDSGPMRSFGEMMVPRYRPVLTRSGIVYTPTLFPMQTGPSLLDRLSGRNWVSNRVHMNQEAEAFKPRHNRIIGVPHYEDSKMIDDYNDYGPNTNTYSYTPVRKVTTQAPPQQIVAPNKFDVFQKLVEASNHPKTQKRTFNEFPGNYPTQRQYPESFGAFNVRRVRRNAWDEPPFQDI